MNYLNYLETEHIINMILTLYSDCQEQMRSVIDVMLMNEWEVIIAILQKNSVKTKDIQKKLHKLQVLYEFNKRRNNELMLWEKMKSLTKMIEKLTCQHVAALTVNQRIKNQLKRLKKIMSKFKKSSWRRENMLTTEWKEQAWSQQHHLKVILCSTLTYHYQCKIIVRNLK